MARVLVIGASRGIGLETVRAALRADYGVRGLVWFRRSANCLGEPLSAHGICVR
jgi:NAD(P)-dependent dehydrogenase (short-subunit alcohol dehydrogenase family)